MPTSEVPGFAAGDQLPSGTAKWWERAMRCETQLTLQRWSKDYIRPKGTVGGNSKKGKSQIKNESVPPLSRSRLPFEGRRKRRFEPLGLYEVRHKLD